ncbi:nitrate- and nitrite sensing domain-containing protein [Streptomyces sp. P9(2023)]|uniref:sensor histidine kinase n=1 Tax=Streptomyces sp. P9(2023) TaxID=3064394 RepID=UPI0028F40ED1|nr:nitrate- and nitrite sensing domain-containing protein [Streptomyces sp. P9(2023)]MDT9692368.1 nitrate- and nitrite sensing domain-containing protein [Streptomyces sp. P9(2023)]
MRFRGKSIRRKIVALLLVPLVSLTGLWGFATVLTGREAGQLLDVGYIVEKVGYPIEDTARVIQKERRESLIYLADPRASDALTTLREQREATDRQLALVRRNAAESAVRGEMRPVASQRLDSLLTALDGLAALRKSVENRSIGRLQALDFYNRLVDPCYSFLITLHALENVEMDKQGRALVGVSRGREMLAREDALVLSALKAERVTAEEIRAVTDLVAQRKQFYEVNLEVLPTVERERFERYWGSPDTEPLRRAEEDLIAAGPTKNPRAVTSARWEERATPVLDDLARENTAAGDRYQDRVQPAAYSVLLKAGIAGVLGFLALLVSVVVSVRIGRELVRDLRRLRKEAQEVSGVRLPSVMRRLAAGELVDVETEVPHLRYEDDEVGQVGQALNTLQRAAVEAAVKQSELRRGVSEVFVNLARRNQVLLHRQLTLLDTMERRTEDTEELADLFRLDHMTTRMRRHAEGLVILSGAAPSRQWRKPVQLMDVVRAAVAEVEDYERIEVRRLPRLGVGGPAVADLTHLIAELLENATVFSPPHTAVQVLGERVANGFTLEIHDRGLGMNPDLLLDANLRLAETPEFELSDTDRLGLFVVSRLAQRQNVRVSLQPSPYGGTTAVVFIPAALLTDAPETEGAGFRLDRTSLERGPRGRADGGAGPGRPGRPALTKVPGGASPATGPTRSAASSLLDGGLDDTLGVPLDGPVELEAPLGVSGFDELLDRSSGDLEDTESERGGLFRPRGHRRGLAPAPDGDQHQQAPDQSPDPTHDRGPVPLPRRRPPTLVVDRGRRVDEPGRAHPTSAQDAESRGAEAWGTEGSVTQGSVTPGTRMPGAPAPGMPPTLVPVPPDGPAPFGGLPRRVRQASLARQLRETDERPDSAASTGSTAPAATDFERDADEVRDRMASMQRGWQRGRRQNAETTAPGTTPEGDGR